MPTSPVPDETPAWIKGDLPAEPPATGAEPGDARATAQVKATHGGTAPEPAGEPEPAAEAQFDSASAEQAEPASEEQTPPALEPFHRPPIEAETAPPGQDGNERLAEVGHERGVVAEAPAAEAPAAEPLGLEALVESLLFVADGAVPVGRLAEALEVQNREVEAALTALAQSYRQRGLSLQRFRDKVQLTTSASAAAQVERFLGLAAATPLSRAALETLAIVAYQQPVTRPQIDAVRGVNSDSVIKNLLSKGLIEELGRAEGPGRPVLYSTTPEFMQHFGLASLSDLPPLALPSADSASQPERILKG